MSSESLDEALAFLDQELQPPSIASISEVTLSSSFGTDVWDADALLASIDDGIGDFGFDSGPATQPIPVAETQSLQSDQAADLTQESTHPTQPKKRRRNKQLNSNKARDERRFEMVRLQREAEDLELTLRQLKTIRSQQNHTDDGTNMSDGATQNDVSGVPAVWQDICARQLTRRLKAERENAQLKKQWEEEKRVVKSIEKMLFRRMALKDVGHPEVSKHTRRTDLPAEYIKRVAAFIFDELSASVEVSYREVGGLFEGNGPVPKNMVTHQPLLRGGMKGMYRRLFDRRVVPFTLQETGDAWWRHWHNYRRQNIHEVASNVVTESFGLEMNDLKTNVSAKSYGQQILRRHVEENRIVFVWNAYIEPFVFENEPVSGVYLLEQSHVLIKPEDPDSTANEGKKDECSTSMSTCYVITPHFLDPELKNDAKTTALIEFLISALSANIKIRNETVENLLLDQALHKHHNSS